MNSALWWSGLFAWNSALPAGGAGDEGGDNRWRALSSPVSYRWRPPGATLWIYDPEPAWFDAHREEIEWEPLYADVRPTEPGRDPATIEACAKIAGAIGQLTLAEQSTQDDVTRRHLREIIDALSPQREGGRHRR
jgi:hypothetical protein